MSNYHILTGDIEKKTITVVFHIPVPAAGTNQANLSWRDAVVKEQGGASNIVSALGTDVNPTEDSQLKSGALVERQQTIRFSSVNLTSNQRRVEIEAAFTQLQSQLIADKQITLDWIGFEGDVL